MFQGTEPLAPAGPVQFSPDACRGRTAAHAGACEIKNTRTAFDSHRSRLRLLKVNPLVLKSVLPLPE